MRRQRFATLAIISVLSISGNAGNSNRVPIPLWSVSLRQFGYALPDTNSDLVHWPLNLAGNEIAIVTTDNLVIAAFVIPLQLLPRSPGSNRLDGRPIRLVAFDLSTGRERWLRDIVACEARPDPFIWAVKGIGYAVRAPASLDLYNENGELIHTTPLPTDSSQDEHASRAGFPREVRAIQGVSPSGRTALVVIPRFADPDNPKPQTLIAIDVVTGQRLGSIRSSLRSAATGDKSMAYIAQPSHITEWQACCAPGVAIKAWGGKMKFFYPEAHHLPIVVGPFISDSRFLAIENSPGHIWTLLVIDTSGKVVKRHQLPYRLRADWYMSFAGAFGSQFALALTPDDSNPPTAQEITVFNSDTLKPQADLPLPSVSPVRAKAALAADGTKLVVFANDTVRLYTLPTPAP